MGKSKRVVGYDGREGSKREMEKSLFESLVLVMRMI